MALTPTQEASVNITWDKVLKRVGLRPDPTLLLGDMLVDASTNSIANVICVTNDGLSGFSSIKAAVESITDESYTNQYVVHVYPGIYNEDPFTIPIYINVRGLDRDTTIVKTTNNGADFITGDAGGSMHCLTLHGPTGAGFATIKASSPGDPFWISDCFIKDGYYGLHATGAGVLIHAFDVSAVLPGTMHTFVRAVNGAVIACVGCGVLSTTSNLVTYGYYSYGTGTVGTADIDLDQCWWRCAGTTNTGIYADNGGEVRASVFVFADGYQGLHVGANGTGTDVDLMSSTFEDEVVKHIRIDSAAPFVAFSGYADYDKFDIAPGANFTGSFASSAEGGGSTVGQITMGDMYLGGSTCLGPAPCLLPVGSYIKSTAQTGHVDGSSVTRNSGLSIHVAAGSGFITTALNDLELIQWDAADITLTASKPAIWIEVGTDGIIKEAFVAADLSNTIILADAATDATNVIFLNERTVGLYNRAATQHEYFRDVMGPLNVTGGVVTKHANPSLQMDVDQSYFYIANSPKISAPSSPITITVWYRDGGTGWKTVSGATGISDFYYDDGSGTLAELPAGKWKRSSLYVSVNDSGTEFHGVYSQQFYDTQLLATDDPVPPDILRTKACRLAAIVVQKSSGDIADIIDLRPRLGQMSGGSTSAITVHGSLSGLAANDHLQYQLRTEKNAANGYAGLDASTKVTSTYLNLATVAPPTITPGGAAIGISAKLAREDHGHNIDVDIPHTIGTTNTEGVSNSLSRHDHVHAHGSQTDGTLHAAATTVTPGFLSTADKTKLDALPALKQTVFVEQAVDTTRNTSSFGTLLTTNITTGANAIKVSFSAGVSGTTANRHAQFRLLIDGVVQRGTGAWCVSANNSMSASLIFKKTVTAALHTVTVEWAAASGVVSIRPVTAPNTEHASLLVEEVSV